MNASSAAIEKQQAQVGTWVVRAPVLSFPQKLVIAFALAVGAPLMAYVLASQAYERARMELVDRSALTERMALTYQHLRATGLEMLWVAAAASSEAGAVGGKGEESRGRLEQTLVGLESYRGVNAACIVHEDPNKPPAVMGKDLMLDGIIGVSPYARLALQGRSSWGLLPLRDHLAVVAATPVVGTDSAKGRRAALVVASKLGPAELARFAGSSECTVTVTTAGEQIREASRALAGGGGRRPRGDSGFAVRSLPVGQEGDYLVGDAVLTGVAEGSEPVLLKVRMQRSALPGRGPEFMAVALGSLILVLVLAVLLTSMVTSWVSRPLEELRTRVEAIADGQRGVPLPETTRDVLGDVAGAFNRMVHCLEEAQRQVLHNERLAMAGRMAASVAHDVRNLLMPIQLRADMLLQGVVDPAARESLQGMRDEVCRSVSLLRTMLDFSRSDTDQMQPVVISDVLQSASDLVAPQMRAANVKLTVQDCTHGVQVWGDRGQLLQVVVNLLNNAAEAESSHITLDAQVIGSQVRIAVKDDGVGMDEETLRQALVPFFTTKPPREGTGLGLSICETVVRSHEGTLSIESAAGLGTCVTIVLPSMGEQVWTASRAYWS